jgi:hypothetical protein
MSSEIDFHRLTVWYTHNQLESLDEWRQELSKFCDQQGIFSREELLRGQGLRVWGSSTELIQVKLSFS